ncbi:MAG: peptidoglycan DD-metalloendopeptidase family protein [Oscillospiraceae bacterium]|nr:peptidoglycan DD-metalloendopeptidase family protein [Oscillospiraceae bacterium]
MANKDNLTKIIVILLASATVFNMSSPYNVFCVDDVTQARNRQRQLKKEAEALKSKLEDKKNNESKVVGSIEQQKREVQDLNAKIASDSEELVALQKKLEASEQSLNGKKSEIASKFRTLQRAVREFDKKGKMSIWEFLFGDMRTDVHERQKVIGWISQGYKQQADRLNAEVEQIRAEHAELMEQKRNLEVKSDELKRKKDELSAKITQMGKELTQIKKEEEITKEQIEKNNAARERQEKEIEIAVQAAIRREQARLAALRARIEAERRAREKKLAEERAKREAEREAARARGEEVKEEEPQSAQPAEDGVLGSPAWPTPGFKKITSPFGEPRGSVTHKGVDIGGAGIHGTPVVAAWDGIVVYTFTGCTHDYGKSGSCGCDGGCGNCVVLAHADGTTTHYYHLSAVSVAQGQNVARGEGIGNVGTTGWSTGPHLHFGYKKDGRWINPMGLY